jgi:integrase
MKQLRMLENMKLEGKEDRVRDLFLVGCYTGLRFSDIRTLRQDHIEGDWIHKTTIKTGTEVWIPYRQVFLGKLQSILQKYGDIGRLTRQTPPNSETNRILRPLLDKLGCSNDITFHSSRHTFATILGQMGVPAGTIQRLLGHTTEKTTMIYNESHRDGRREILKSLKNKFQKTTNNEKNHDR